MSVASILFGTPAVINNQTNVFSINSLGWTASGAGFVCDQIPALGVKSTSVISSFIQLRAGYAAGNVAEASNAWIIASHPTDGFVQFVCASDPTTYSPNVQIAWVVESY
jgi:hypothetical protein